MERILLLGASGSIGEQTLEIIKDNPKDFFLVGVSVGHKINKLEEILENFSSIQYVCVQEEQDYLELKNKYPHLYFYYGDDGLIDIIRESKVDKVVNALVGFVGFRPSLETLKEGLNLCLANKESLVVGGELLLEAKKKTKANLYAIDSEHTALDKCLKNHSKEEIKKLVITASGGSLRDYEGNLEDVTVEQVLKHPSWSMGQKITIDSATMMNKAFEIVEAMFLFNYSLEKIDILLHDESIIHSLVEFIDHSFVADIGPTDMKTSISYALYNNERKDVDVKELNLAMLGSLHFRQLDLKKYPCLVIALTAIQKGMSSRVVLNRANEEAVHAFLDKKIKYTDISLIIEEALKEHKLQRKLDEYQIVELDRITKEKCQEIIRRYTCK